MNNIFLGTVSDTKLEIIKECVDKKYNITPVEVETGISDQPLDENTTIRGAINRAKKAIDPKQDYDFSVGLEGGLTKIGDLYYLFCVAAIVDKNDNIYVGISNKLPLPDKVSKRLANGEQFGEVIRDFKKITKEESSEFIGYIDELITRKKSFSTAFNISFLAYRFSREFV
ncbi:MAG: NTPase [Parcubacteria group bacterium Licking1014_1]|nr:MAG: NTPase [Parcubacteria group bacterium Licking1014_1]